MLNVDIVDMFYIINNINCKKIVIALKTKWSTFFYCS
jgi:hypothetical protein